MLRQQALLSLTAPGAAFEITPGTGADSQLRTFKAGPQTLRELFDQSRSDAPFLVFGLERLSFDTTWRRAAAVAARLKSAYGIRKGDRIAIAMRNCPEWLIAFQAITSLGAIAVAFNAHWPPEDLTYALADANPRLLFADERTMAKLDPGQALPRVISVRCATVYHHATPYELAFGKDEAEAAPRVSISTDDHATIFYTSGSTGRPKGVLSTHRNILTTLLSWELDAAALALTAEPVPATPFPPAALLAVPLFHVTGLHSAYLASFRLQRRVVIMERWNPLEAARLIERERVTNLTAPSAITGDLLAVAKEGHFDLSSLGAIGGGGASRAASQVRELDSTLKAVPLTGWGMTETNASGTSIFGEEYLARPESSGRVSFMMDLRIVDGEGHVLPALSRGELQVRGASVAKAYWRRPDARDEAFDGDWFRTGDVAYLDDEGFLFIVDRIKDVVIRGGENIGCGAVETALLDYPSIVEAVVYGVPDERLGERVGATIRTVGDVDLAALRDYLAGRLAPFQVPDHVRTVKAALPRTASGKVLRREARDEALAAMVHTAAALSA